MSEATRVFTVESLPPDIFRIILSYGLDRDLKSIYNLMSVSQKMAFDTQSLSLLDFNLWNRLFVKHDNFSGCDSTVYSAMYFSFSSSDIMFAHMRVILLLLSLFLSSP